MNARNERGVELKWIKMYPIGSTFEYNSPYGGKLYLKVYQLYDAGIMAKSPDIKNKGGYVYSYIYCKPYNRYQKLKRILNETI